MPKTFQKRAQGCPVCHRYFISEKRCKTFTQCCSPKCTRKRYYAKNRAWLKANPAKRKLYNQRRNAIYAKTRATVRGVYSQI